MTYDFQLEHKVELYIPSTYDVNGVASKELINEMTSNVINLFNLSFGGCTCINANGAYVAKNGDVILEPVIICQAYAFELTDKKMASVDSLAKHICKTMKQECISVVFDGVMHFVDYKEN